MDELPRLLGEVSPASCVVLSLHHLEDRRLEEIDEILAISFVAVKSRLAYGLTVLRQLVKGTHMMSAPNVDRARQKAPDRIANSERE